MNSRNQPPTIIGLDQVLHYVSYHFAVITNELVRHIQEVPWDF